MGEAIQNGPFDKWHRMKIVQIITRSDATGGAHVHVRDLSLALLREGHQVTVLVGREGPFTEELRDMGIPYRTLRYLVRPIRPVTDFRGVLEMRRILAELEPDLVCVHSSKAGWLGRLAARTLGIPSVFTAHGWAFTEGVPGLRRMIYVLAERLAAPLGQRIITVSEFDCELALRCRVAPPKKLVTVHNGVPGIAPSLRANPASQPPRLIMVARFEKQKDHITLLRALTKLRETDWHLELVGDGPLMGSVRDEARRLGIQGRVRFWGTRQDVAEILSQGQIFILVSNYEGFPLTILEAMRAGLPVVASDVGGVKEAVVDGETGFLIPRGDEDALRDTLLRLLLDTDLRAKMGTAGRLRYQEHFTFERMLEKTVKVYYDVTGAGKSATR